MAQGAHKTAEHVMGAMRQRILGGVWRPEEMLPGRRALAAEYGVALATLERAVAVLMSEGLLRADNGRGTFVTFPVSPSGQPAVSSEPQARARRTPLVATVAVVAAIAPEVSDDAAQWPLNILRACEDQLGAVSGMTTRFVNVKTRAGLARSPAEVLEEIRQAAPDGIILISNFNPFHDVLASLPDVRMVDVVFDPEETASRQVTVDEPYGGMQAARHLLNQGYRKLLYLQPFEANWVANRLAGVRAAVARAGSLSVPLDVWPEVQAPLPDSGDVGRQHVLAYEAAQSLLRDGLEVGIGVIAPNDFIAVEFMKAAREHGFEAGTDYGIIGFDDYERWADLSTMRPPLDQLGIEAARLMERVLRGEAVASRVMVHHRLIPRGSTRRWDNVSER